MSEIIAKQKNTTMPTKSRAAIAANCVKAIAIKPTNSAMPKPATRKDPIIFIMGGNSLCKLRRKRVYFYMLLRNGGSLLEPVQFLCLVGLYQQRT